MNTADFAPKATPAARRKGARLLVEFVVESAGFVPKATPVAGTWVRSKGARRLVQSVVETHIASKVTIAITARTVAETICMSVTDRISLCE